MTVLKTTDLIPGDIVLLASFGETPLDYRHRLFAFGLRPGVCVEVIRYAPLGCPIELSLKGTHVMLRAEEAALLCWERSQ